MLLWRNLTCLIFPQCHADVSRYEKLLSQSIATGDTSVQLPAPISVSGQNIRPPFLPLACFTPLANPLPSMAAQASHKSSKTSLWGATVAHKLSMRESNNKPRKVEDKYDRTRTNSGVVTFMRRLVNWKSKNKDDSLFGKRKKSDRREFSADGTNMSKYKVSKGIQFTLGPSLLPPPVPNAAYAAIVIYNRDAANPLSLLCVQTQRLIRLLMQFQRRVEGRNVPDSEQTNPVHIYDNNYPTGALGTNNALSSSPSPSIYDLIQASNSDQASDSNILVPNSLLPEDCCSNIKLETSIIYIDGSSNSSSLKHSTASVKLLTDQNVLDLASESRSFDTRPTSTENLGMKGRQNVLDMPTSIEKEYSRSKQNVLDRPTSIEKNVLNRPTSIENLGAKGRVMRADVDGCSADALDQLLPLHSAIAKQKPFTTELDLRHPEDSDQEE